MVLDTKCYDVPRMYVMSMENGSIINTSNFGLI